jgi:excisionase family DNA binding protein
MSSRLLTSAELAEKLNWSLSTIHNRLSQGKPMPPAMKIGGELRFPEDELHAWLDAQRLPSVEQSQK